MLDATAAGTNADPNIQGGYIKATQIGSDSGSFSISPTGYITGASLDVTSDVSAATVYGDTFRIKGTTDSTKTAKAVHIMSTTTTTGTITAVGDNYGTGFRVDRVISTGLIQVTAVGQVYGYDSVSNNGTTTLYLERSINGGAYTVVSSDSVTDGKKAVALHVTEAIGINNYHTYRLRGYVVDDGTYSGNILAYIVN